MARDAMAQALEAGGDRVVRAELDQLTWHWSNQLRPRLDGLTDDEYLWEPVADCWSVRRRTATAPQTATMRAGGGEWAVDFAVPPPNPEPVTTIAWRLAHVIVGVLAVRTYNHFDGPEASYESWEYAGTAADALAQLDAAYDAWVRGVESLSDAALQEAIGPAEGPWADRSMQELVLHINREVIHHGAEIALLRDLYRAQPSSGDRATSER